MPYCPRVNIGLTKGRKGNRSIRNCQRRDSLERKGKPANGGSVMPGKDFRTDPVTANKWTFGVVHTARHSSSSNTGSALCAKN